MKPWQLDSDLINDEDKATLVRIRAMLEEKIGGLRCDAHGEEPTAIVSGPSCQQLETEMKACCAEFEHMVSKRLESPTSNH